MIHAHRLVYYRASAQQAIREWWAKTTMTLPREGHGFRHLAEGGSLRPTPFTWVGVGAHTVRISTSPYAREPQ
jgi:hypothetical protein